MVDSYYLFLVQLAEGVIDVLDALKVWELNTADEWTEMTQLGLRILLGFAAYDDIEVCKEDCFTLS